MPHGVAPVGVGFEVSPAVKSPVEAAQAFESLLLKQLFSAMSKTVGQSGLLGGGFQQKLYSDMFSSAIAESAAGSGLGLSEMIQEALGVEKRVADQLRSLDGVIRGAKAYRATVSGRVEPPVNGTLAQLAARWLGDGAADRWGAEGKLTPDDLAAQLVTEGVGGRATFNVNDASGYEGHPKCNLFAFEMLRRAGYAVPVRARSRGWSYPGASTIARLGERDQVQDWAQVRTGSDVAMLDAQARSGKPFLLASSAVGDAAGHMAIADRLHNITRNEKGEITTIEYSGWEAGSRRANYGRRIWRLASIPGQGRGGLEQITILEPKRPAGDAVYFPISDQRPGASHLDAPPSRISEVIQGSPGDSDIDSDGEISAGVLEGSK